MEREARFAFLVLFVFFAAASLPAATNIGLSLDTSRAASAIIGPAGGTVVATAADGTMFTLMIPANALLNSEQITMTPLAHATNVPLSGGLVAGVQLEPSGLRLLNTATLTLSMPHPVPPSLETPVGWHADGRDLYLQPLVIDPKSITFKVIHFSGAGIGSGTDAQRQVILRDFPCDADAALQQRVMPILLAERERERQDLPPDLTFYAQIQSILSDYYNFTIRPEMKVVLLSKDEDIIFSAAVRIINADRAIAFWLEEDDPLMKKIGDDLKDFIGDAMTIVSDLASERCSSEHKIGEIQTLVRAQRIVELFGSSVDLGTQQKVDRCGSFELVFDSTLADFENTMHAVSTVPIQLHLQAPAGLVATAALTYTYNVTIPNPGSCTYSAHGVDDVFTVLDFEIDLNLKTPEDICAARRRPAHPAAQSSDGPAIIKSITINPGNPLNSLTITCPGAPPQTNENSVFAPVFFGFHMGEWSTRFPGAVEIRNWSPGTGGALISRKVYQKTLAPTTETTTLDLFHRAR